MSIQSYFLKLSAFSRETANASRSLQGSGFSFFLLFSVLLLSPGNSAAFSMPIPDRAAEGEISLVIFSDKPLPNLLWPTLVDALRKEIAENAADFPAIAAAGASSSIQIVRGETILPGVVVNKSIIVFLHGECSVSRWQPFIVSGQNPDPHVLGWVKSDHGKIDQFIHVECSHIAQVLRPEAVYRRPAERDQQMATAIARVTVHEWIHIATQNPHHTRHGVFQAQLGINDLVASEVKPRNRFVSVGLRGNGD